MSIDHDEFVRYYADESTSAATIERFASIKAAVLRFVARHGGVGQSALSVADIGCGAGSQSIMWARDGHRVEGIDINGPLIELARERAQAAGVDARFFIGSAENLPWGDRSIDVCLVPELLEHVESWDRCLDEFARILRPGGVIFLSTNNVLCPRQAEFDLPLYSWYPRPLKRYYERLARTTRPELVNHAEYPAIHWFSYYGLKREFEKRGLQSYDRFDLVDSDGLSRGGQAALAIVRSTPLTRWLGQVATPYTTIFGLKT